MPSATTPHPDRPVLTEILSQGGKTFIGELNPDYPRHSKVKYIYKNEKDQTICSAFRASGTSICTSTFIYPHNGRCSRHGGASLSGVAVRTFKHGKYSKSLPARLQGRYEEALADDKLTDFTEDLAVIDARLHDLYLQLDEGGGGEIFLEANDAWKSFKYANSDGDKQQMRESMRRLDDALRKGSTESGVWNEVRLLQDQRRKIILAQAKHLQLTNQTITTMQAQIMVAALLDAVKTEVADAGILNRIQQKFLSVINIGRKQLKA